MLREGLSIPIEKKEIGRGTLVSKLKMLMQYFEANDKESASANGIDEVLSMITDVKITRYSMASLSMEDLKSSFMKMMRLFRSLTALSCRCYIALKLQVHLLFFSYLLTKPRSVTLIDRARDFSSNNISDYYQHLFRFYTNISQILPDKTVTSKRFHQLDLNLKLPPSPPPPHSWTCSLMTSQFCCG